MWGEPGHHRVRLLALFVVVIAYLLFFHATGARHLWQPDEDEYILVNREMVEDGHWIYPTFGGKPYSIKPPLFDWLGSGFAVALGGVSELPSRLPSAFAALAGLFVAWNLGRRMFGARAGFLAALVLATTPIYVEFSRWIQINMLSTVLNLAAMSLFWWGYTTPRRRGLAYVLMYVPMGFGVLNMGLVNLAMPAVVIGAFLLVRREWRHLLALRIHWGVLVVLAIAGPWYAVVCRSPEYRDGLLMVTNFDRFFTTSLGHTRPFWYYLKTTPPSFLPWTLFLPSAVIALRTAEGEEDRKPLVFLIVWVAALFVFFSLSRTKRTEYLLPVYPAMALLVGYVIDRGAARGAHSGRWRALLAWPVRLTVVLVVLGGVAAAVAAGIEGHGWLPLALPAAGLLVAGGVAAGFSFRAGRPAVAVGALAAAAALAVAWSAHAMIDRLNAEKSVVAFCDHVADRFPEGTPVRQFRHQGHAFGYYLRRPAEKRFRPDALDEWLRSPERVFVITKEDEFEEIRDQLSEEAYVVHREWVDHRNLLLISNRPD